MSTGRPGTWRRAVDGGAQPFVGEGGRQPNVDDGDVGPDRDQLLGELRPVVDGGHDVEAVRGQHAGQPVAEQDLVLGDQDAHGSSISSTVGPPAGLSTRSVAVERGQPAPDAAQAGAAGRVGAAPPVVAHGDAQRRPGVHDGR